MTNFFLCLTRFLQINTLIFIPVVEMQLYKVGTYHHGAVVKFSGF